MHTPFVLPLSLASSPQCSDAVRNSHRSSDPGQLRALPGGLARASHSVNGAHPSHFCFGGER